jgi:hypothetical protein
MLSEGDCSISEGASSNSRKELSVLTIVHRYLRGMSARHTTSASTAMLTEIPRLELLDERHLDCSAKLVYRNCSLPSMLGNGDEGGSRSSAVDLESMRPS